MCIWMTGGYVWHSSHITFATIKMKMIIIMTINHRLFVLFIFIYSFFLYMNHCMDDDQLRPIVFLGNYCGLISFFFSTRCDLTDVSLIATRVLGIFYLVVYLKTGNCFFFLLLLFLFRRWDVNLMSNNDRKLYTHPNGWIDG